VIIKEGRMNTFDPEKYLSEIPNFEQTAKEVSRGIHERVLEGGDPARKLVDLLHGTWLGHPLHPVLTDFAIGAWIGGAVLDLLSISRRSRSLEKAADQLTGLGTIAAVPTALAGIADYSTIPTRAMSTGAAHGLLNATALVLYLLSSLSRKAGIRSLGLFLSSLALGLLAISGYLGGELAFKYKVGVNKQEEPGGPADWAIVMSEASLPEGEPRRVSVEGVPILLYRYGGAVYAIGATCGHDGGPLDQGKFDGLCVECPWHQSVYDLRDGSVIHGPTTYSAASYDTRIVNGNIQLRLRETA
jgi:nitrite reductase/ring-hydroxylating ferredoxin subunit/uncharacterized membrane protein